MAASRSTRTSRRIRASREAVYRALLDPDAIAAWRSPDDMAVTVHEFQPEPGSRFRISLTYDHPTDTGKTSERTDTYHGHFAALTPDRSVVEVVEFETDDPDLQGRMTVTTTLTDASTESDEDPLTEVVILHEDLPPGVAPADNELGTAMSLDKLAVLLEPPTVAEIYSRGLDFLSSVVDRFPDGAWERPSPCTGWRAVDVVGHLGLATRFGTELLGGGRPEWQPPATPGDAVEGPPKQWWADLAGRAHQVMAAVDLDRIVETPAGSRRVADGLAFPAVDLFVHGWDLARTAGLDVEMPAEAIRFGRSVLEPIPEAQLRRPATFGPPVPAPAGATETDVFVAWTGRDPHWPA